jgi:signal transduction histidine kinase
MYLFEPYDLQKNIIQRNFAFRDYYKGAVATGKPYLSEVFLSMATDHNVSVLAVPIYSEGNGSLVGIWGGAVDLNMISEALKTGSNRELIAYVDQQGHKVASSNVREYLALIGNNESLISKNVIGFKEGMTGKSGYTIETINGIKMFVAYAPVHALSTNWVVLSFEPYDKLFLSSNAILLNGVVMSVVFVSAAAIIAMLIYRSFRALNGLTVKLHKLNEDLSLKEKELQKAKRSLEEKNKELAEANDQLRLSEKIQKDFINVAAHELRTPIVPILNLAELLDSKFKKQKQNWSKGKMEGLEGWKKIEEMVQVIVRNAYRLYQLLEDILDVTRMETQSLKLGIEQLDLGELVSSAMRDFKKNNENRNTVNIRFESRSNGIFVSGDRGRLVQVLTNLLNNALKFTKVGDITVTLDKQNSTALLTVRDTGSGIDDEIYPRLFSKFATKSDAGTGLGLYISKNIVESHGGKIWAENNPDRKGSTFYVTLPISSSEQSKHDE